jgi:OOP family OmpA-OmpF porin
MTELPPFNSPPPRPDAPPVESGIPEVSSPTAPTVVEPPEPSRWQGVRSLSVWILRWALLGAGVGGAWCFGMLVAQFFPASDPEPPLIEVVTRRTARFFQKVGNLPEWWTGETALSPTALPAASTDAPPATTTPPPRPIALTPEQREQVSVELDAIANNLQTLRDRTSAVERQLALPDADLPLEERLDNAANRLNPPTTAAPSNPNPTTPALQPAAGEPPDPLFQVNAYRVTLPSDVLFLPGQATLQPNAPALLDSILSDVARYPESTVVVGSHTDIETEGATATDLSYQQAIAVQQYLAQRLGDETVRWVPVGYGNSTLGSTGTVQLSRRITLAIVP